MTETSAPAAPEDETAPVPQRLLLVLPSTGEFDSRTYRIATAAIAHLAHSTPPEFLFTTTDFNSYVTVSTATGAPQRNNGRMTTSLRPGLGIVPRMEVLGRPVVDVH